MVLALWRGSFLLAAFMTSEAEGNYRHSGLQAHVGLLFSRHSQSLMSGFTEGCWRPPSLDLGGRGVPHCGEGSAQLIRRMMLAYSPICGKCERRGCSDQAPGDSSHWSVDSSLLPLLWVARGADRRSALAPLRHPDNAGNEICLPCSTLSGGLFRLAGEATQTAAPGTLEAERSLAGAYVITQSITLVHR